MSGYPWIPAQKCDPIPECFGHPIFIGAGVEVLCESGIRKVLIQMNVC